MGSEGGRPGLRERKKARLRQQIMTTAVDFFRSRGYAGTRVADIVEALEISQPTFFRYYPSKDAVLKDALALVLGHLRSETEAACAAGKSLEDVLKATYQKLGELVTTDRALTRAIGVSGAAISWVREDQNEAPAQDALDLLIETFEYGRKRGELRPAVAPEQAADIFCGTLVHLIFGWATQESPKHDLRTQLDTAIETVCRGLRP